MDCLSISYQVTPVEVGVHDDLRLKPPETLEYDFGWSQAFIFLSHAIIETPPAFDFV